jgi:signal peptidase I
MVVNAAALFIVVLVIGLYGIALLPNLFGYHVVAVSSGSMSPSIQVSDVIVLSEPDHANIGVGAVVDFATETGGVLHRVVEILPEGYRTKGDANQIADSVIVPRDTVSGVGIYVVPLVGMPTAWLADGEWYKAVGLAVAFFAALRFSRAAWLEKRRRSPRRGRPTATRAEVGQ